MTWLDWVRREVETRRVAWRASRQKTPRAGGSDRRGVRQKLLHFALGHPVPGLEAMLTEVGEDFIYNRELAGFVLARLIHVFRQRGQPLEGERLLAQVRLDYHIKVLTNSYLY